MGGSGKICNLTNEGEQMVTHNVRLPEMCHPANAWRAVLRGGPGGSRYTYEVGLRCQFLTVKWKLFCILYVSYWSYLIPLAWLFSLIGVICSLIFKVSADFLNQKNSDHVQDVIYVFSPIGSFTDAKHRSLALAYTFF